MFLRSFIILTLIAYAVGAVGAIFLDFGSLYRMLDYHYEHPFAFVAVVAIPYGLLAALWVTFLGDTRGALRWISLLAVIVGTLLVSCLLGGLLWMYYDIMAGFFPAREQLLRDLEANLSRGLVVGPVIVLLSFPLNVAALIVGLNAPGRVRRWLIAKSSS